MIRSLCSVLLTVSLSACNTPAPARFFTLMPASDVSAPAQHGVGGSLIVLGPTTIPASLDQAQIVLNKSNHEVDIRENERWASPLKDEITAALAARLAPLAGSATVTAYPQAAGDRADTQVLVDFSRLDLRMGDRVTLDALWTIKRADSDTHRHGRTVATIPAGGKDYEHLVASLGKALDRLARDIAARLREPVR